MILGIDTGGTFTDFVLLSGGELSVHKVLSVPKAPEQAILKGIREMGLVGQDVVIVHGSTVATNAALEGKGVKTAYIANKGFKDVLTLGRQNREALFNLTPKPVSPPVPGELCFELPGRVDKNGRVLVPLDEDVLNDLVDKLLKTDVAAVAINQLFSFVNADNEKTIKQAIAKRSDHLFISCSHEVLPQYREYERGIATWLNASLSPIMRQYLSNLEATVSKNHPDYSLAMMTSTGETCSLESAGNRAIDLLLSGPAGGLSAVQYIAHTLGGDKFLTFDMGGTSTDVAIYNAGIGLTNNGSIGRYPVQVTMVDMHTIGAGGGSLVWIDEGNALRVGPRSAGADPGPVCYGQGGDRLTVTDANVRLKRILPEHFLGGQMTLDVTSCDIAFDKLARQTAMETQQLAEGIVAIANEKMSQALRVISVERGENPSDYTLVSFGGAGPLHVCQLAESLNMTKALVPYCCGVLSALGMVFSKPGKRRVQAVLKTLEALSDNWLNEIKADMVQWCLSRLLEEHPAVAALNPIPTVLFKLRYQGQNGTIDLVVNEESDAVETLAQRFHQAHENRFGHRLDLSIELVEIEVSATTDSYPPVKAFGSKSSQDALPVSVIQGHNEQIKLYRREQLNTEQTIEGPALIIEDTATTYLALAWQARLDGFGHLHLEKMAEKTA